MQSRPAPTMSRYPAVFAMFIVTGASRNMASRHVATMLNHSSSDGIGGEQDVHDMTVGVHDMTAGAAKGVTPTAKHSQHLGEVHAARHPAESKLQAPGSPVHQLSPSALTRVRALDLVAGSAPEPGGGHVGTQRYYEPDISKDRRRHGGMGRRRRRPALAHADVAGLAVARGDDGRTYRPRLRAVLPCAGVPSASLDSPARITIRAARKLSLQAEPLQRGAGLEVPRRTPRTWWPHGGRRAPRLATAARAVARGLHRGGHHLLQ